MTMPSGWVHIHSATCVICKRQGDHVGSADATANSNTANYAYTEARPRRMELFIRFRPSR